VDPPAGAHTARPQRCVTSPGRHSPAPNTTAFSMAGLLVRLSPCTATTFVPPFQSDDASDASRRGGRNGHGTDGVRREPVASQCQWLIWDLARSRIGGAAWSRMGGMVCWLSTPRSARLPVLCAAGGRTPSPSSEESLTPSHQSVHDGSRRPFRHSHGTASAARWGSVRRFPNRAARCRRCPMAAMVVPQTG
jgi:hypothetical protein